jgi:hypothetical protein
VVQPLRACRSDCELSDNPERLADADAVIFHVPDLDPRFALKKPRGQIWVAMSKESSTNFPQLDDPAFMQRFDYTMTYRMDSDFPFPYFESGMLPELVRAPQPKDATAPAVFFSSSAFNQSRRYGYTLALMQRMEVHSYGKCLRNRTLPHDEGAATKLATIAHYKFTLAFENSIAHDYVTEKFFEPLRVGSVPVYLGAPNVDDLAPGDRCYINARRFRSPWRLAQYLLWLDANPDEYDTYLAWKQRGLRPRFLEQVERVRTPPFCRLCATLAGASNP